MNSYIKHIIEAFDFNSANKQKKTINAIDILKKEQLPIIFDHIDKREQLNEQDYSILTYFDSIYKVYDNNSLKELIKYFIKQFGNECNLNWIELVDGMFPMLLIWHTCLAGARILMEIFLIGMQVM